MARRTRITFVKTYASVENAERTLAKFPFILENDSLRFDIMPTIVEGQVRYGILFFGMNAIEAGIHYHFNVVG